MEKIVYEKSYEIGELEISEIREKYRGMVENNIRSDYEKLEINMRDFYEDEVYAFEVYTDREKLYVFANIEYDGEVYFEVYEVDHCVELGKIITEGITPDKHKIIDSIAIQLMK